jgi:hypothetical protein
MTLPDPKYRVTMHRSATREACSLLAFDLTHAEVYLAVYCALGWTGEIVEIVRVMS